MIVEVKDVVSFLFMFFASIASGAITPAVAMKSIDVINPIYYAKVLIFGTLYSSSNKAD